MTEKMLIDKVYLGDCIEIMAKMPKNSINLIFADPPFNIGIKYDRYNDNLSYDEYYNWSKKWISETYKVLKNNGSIYIAIGDEFAAEINIILKQTGFYFRNWIIWYYTFGQSQRKKFNRAHTHIFYFTKDKEDFKFNTEYIRVPSARQLIYNDRRANPKGKLPDDVWQISRVCGTFKERLGEHPCQMPESLLERIIQVSSDVGDLILDPFGGTGTTPLVAKRLNRHYLAIESSETYYNLILKRLSPEIEQKKLFAI
ncbi:MAG: site-specific DNA-methyltransferase [Candidatus Melainabacteria bacterium]|nr:site-specific DNA-methyltransferase [Candidatus Melainabacteria bacterium]